MPSRPAEKTTFRNPLPVKDLLVSGRELGLPMVDYVAANHRFTAGTMSWHSHQGHEILMLLSGSTGYEFPGGAQARLQGGEMMIVPRGTDHRGLDDVRQASTLCAIVFDPSPPRARTTPFTGQEREWLSRHYAGATPTPKRMSSAIRQLAKALRGMICLHASGRGTVGLAASMRMTVASIIIETARENDCAGPKQTSRLVGGLIRHMERNFAQPLAMDDLARSAGCSRARLFAVFKRETGMTPNDWLQRHRIQAATALLRGTDRKLDDIAQATGFSSAQYFCQVFRKYTGKTPGEHRVAGAEVPH